ncbi:MAG TPA: oligosaccharide flippase family protein, partial [Burkholderiaceae bacterium]
MSVAVGSLRRRVMRSGGITATGYAANQVLRFASNLILTRLLFPEAFGIMAIMQTVVVGVTMLSDVGVAQSVVRHARGAEPSFLNTAWTIQIAKGALMAIALWAASGPVARAYHQPMLEGMMPWAALAALVGGFASTKVALANRNVETLHITLVNFGALATGIVATMLFAWHNPTPYALVWGNLCATIASVVASHAFLHGPSNRLAWDRAVALSILSFGGWVMLSSAVGYMTGEGNKLVVASLIDIRLLGLFGLASTLSVAISQAVGRMSSQVLFGAYSELFRIDRSRLSRAVERARRVQ